MNKKQLIVAWITGLLISFVCLNPSRNGWRIDFAETILHMIPILIIGILLIFTLRNDNLVNQIKKILSKIKKIIPAIKKFINLHSQKITRVAKREIIPLGAIIVLGLGIIFSSKLLPSPPRTFSIFEEFDYLSSNESIEVNSWLVEIGNYRSSHPGIEKLSVLDVAEKMANENPAKLKAYNELKTISEKTLKNGKFDWLSSVEVEDKRNSLSKIKDRISNFINNTFTKEKVSEFGWYFSILGYPFYLIICLIIWGVNEIRKET